MDSNKRLYKTIREKKELIMLMKLHGIEREVACLQQIARPAKAVTQYKRQSIVQK